MTTTPPGYPREWETHAVLNDGAPVEIRPIRPADRDLLDAFYKRQSRQSIYYRYFQFRPQLTSKELEFFTEVDYVERMAFVALLGGELVAVARYERMPDGRNPELAFFVDDGHHGRGLATLMFEYLAAAARSQGLRGFTASVLPENHAMLGVFRHAGFPVETRFDDGLIAVEIDIEVTAETAEAIARRASRARSASVARLLQPSSVAIVGAGRSKGSVGHEILRNLLNGGFAGELMVVNPNADAVLGIRSWPRLSDIGAPVDLAIIVVPATEIERVVTDAAEADVGGLLVVSSGFAESGEEGVERERRLVAMARSNGMRLIGPNAFGLINTAPDIRLRAVFLYVPVEKGPVGVLSQSGPLGAALLEHLRSGGLGVSSFVAVGNRADVSVNDVLGYWLDDAATGVALLYVENYGNLRNFARSARALSVQKPVVAVRPAEDHLVDLLAQSGVVLVDDVAEMAELARVACEQTLPRGRRVVVVSNTASVARLAELACRRAGLELVVPESVGQPHTFSIRSGDSVLVGNVDTIAGEPVVDHESALVAAAVGADVDAVLVAMVPTLDLPIEDLAALLGRVDRSIDKPIVATGLIGSDRLSVPGLPLFAFPDEAARPLGRLADYAEWRRSNPREPLFDDDSAGALEAEIRPLFRGLLDHPSPDNSSVEIRPAETIITMVSTEAREAVDILGLDLPPWVLVESKDDLAAAGESIGYPVVLKAASDRSRSVGEVGGAAIDLHNLAQLEGAFTRMYSLRGGSMLPALVQEMIPSSANIRIELLQAPELGAVIGVGLGGAAGAAAPLAARRYLPLLADDETILVDALARLVRLDPASRSVIGSMLTRLAEVALAVPELARVSVDPVLIAGAETAAGDIEVTLSEWHLDPLADVRRL